MYLFWWNKRYLPSSPAPLESAMLPLILSFTPEADVSAIHILKVGGRCLGANLVNIISRQQ